MSGESERDTLSSTTEIVYPHRAFTGIESLAWRELEESSSGDKYNLGSDQSK
jgi:hypothetical protein